MSVRVSVSNWPVKGSGFECEMEAKVVEKAAVEFASEFNAGNVAGYE